MSSRRARTAPVLSVQNAAPFACSMAGRIAGYVLVTAWACTVADTRPEGRRVAHMPAVQQPAVRAYMVLRAVGVKAEALWDRAAVP